jgi:hypothetical protein
MSDTTATAASPDIKSKITMKDMGNPKAAAAFEVGDGKRHFLGRVKGFASGQIQKLDDKGEVLYGLKGVFMAEMPGGKRLQSGVLYLPGGIQEAVSEAIPDDQGRVGFAFDIFTEASANKAGYSYVVTPIHKVAVEDPFAGLGEMPALPAIVDATAKK